MSDRPKLTIEQVISKIEQLTQELDKLNHYKTEAAKIPESERICSKLQSEILKEIEKRDVIQRGNFGWENRSISFLMSLVYHCRGTKSKGE